MAPLDTAGWAHNGSGEIVNGQTRSRGNDAFFKHAQELQGGDVWRMRVEGGSAAIGFATEQYNVENDEDTYNGTAWVVLGNGTTVILSDISQDGEKHSRLGHLEDHIPKTKPYDVAVRITKDGNLPQIQFNDDSVWHDFAPGRVALKAGPWFPYLFMDGTDLLSDHRVDRPKPTKSAGKTGPNKDAKTAKTAKAAPPASSNAQKTRANGRSKSVAPSRPKIVKSPKIANTP